MRFLKALVAGVSLTNGRLEYSSDSRGQCRRGGGNAKCKRSRSATAFWPKLDQTRPEKDGGQAGRLHHKHHEAVFSTGLQDRQDGVSIHRDPPSSILFILSCPCSTSAESTSRRAP